MQNSNPLRAITTRYSGYAFRSRLEARWAVFFDHLKIRWEYEAEGFELGNGLRYLPDFWLPDWDLWVEVKSGPPDAVTLEKARSLAEQSRRPIFITNGMPINGGTLATIAFGVSDAPMECEAEVDWGAGDDYVAWLFTDDIPPWTGVSAPGGVMDLSTVPLHKKDEGWWTPPAQDALVAAKSARFEFGAKGNVK